MTIDNNHLLVICETSKTSKQDLISSFNAFEEKYEFDCSSVKREITKHDKYFTNNKYYFRYNSKLSFLQKFRSKKEDVLKLYDYYKTFDPEKTSFWTITKKTFPLDKIIFKATPGRVKIEFEEINETERNLKALFKRLSRYGYQFTKYILVPEIKEENFLYNYHYHMLCEVNVDLSRIRKIKNPKYKNLVFHPGLKQDLDNGWIDFKLLSSIWKEITQNDSYRIKREEIRKKEGVFHYCLSYMNKGVQYQNISSVPYLYYALKSKKAYRIKGCKKLPKIEFEVLDEKRRRINFDFVYLNFVEREEIPIEKQEYFLLTRKDNNLIEEKNIIEYFNDLDKRQYNNNELISNFDRKLIKNKFLFKKEFNQSEIESVFSKKELQKLLTEGTIFCFRKGYSML